jgi:hypothetical protein
MPNGTTLTVLSVHAPLAAEDPAVAMKLAKNVVEKGFKYVFLYPPRPRDAVKGSVLPGMERIRCEVEQQSVVRAALVQLLESDKNEVASDDNEFITARLAQLNGSILAACTSSKSSWGCHFWGLVPRYAVLYNVLGKDDRYAKFGMYRDKGLSGYAPMLTDSQRQMTVEGWTYLPPPDQEQLFRLIEDPTFKILDDDIRSKWPRPGQGVHDV